MKRLLFGCAAATLVILALPFCVSRNTATKISVPLQSQALGGHTAHNPLVDCSCGAADCICDPGEETTALTVTRNQSKTSASNKGFPTKPATPENEPELAMLIVALLFAVLLRMR